MERPAMKALTLLKSGDELRQRLGEPGAQLSVRELHPWVSTVVTGLWVDGRYGLAVAQAAASVNSHTQAKLRRFDTTETGLFSEAFSTDPPKPGRPRLRIMPDDDSKSFASVHRGARALAEGLYAGIRNPLAHQVDAGLLAQQVALEQVAAFSLLARWVDSAEVVTA